jgi:protein-L-isoaspartate O-methyltransferase
MNLTEELALYVGAMFCACMVCHGELARLKPRPAHLTEFYLCISAGGAIGGLLVALAAPNYLKANYEWQIGVALSACLSAGLLLLAPWRKRDAATDEGLAATRVFEHGRSKPLAGGIPPREPRRLSASIILRGTLFGCAVLGVAVYLVCSLDDASYVRDRARNFYGAIAVCDCYAGDAEKHQTLLRNGQITHGCQSVDPAKRRWPTTYYGETSGVGRAILGLQKTKRVRVGAIGLGVGTLAAYARPGDLFRFYEINPQVIEMAKKHFSYLADCRGECEIKLGDARLSLEAEPPREKFDVIVVDAFSGDSIPTHLLTVEAFEIYRKHLAGGGVIAVHVSNRYLRLAPVARRLAEKCGMRASRIDDAGNESRLQGGSLWVLVSNNDRFLLANPSRPADWGNDNFAAPLWTDQYSNLFQILASPR